MDGAPSEDILAFCRASKPEERELESGVFLHRLGDVCRLSVETRSPAADELIAVLRTIRMWHAARELPDGEELTRRFPNDPMWDTGQAIDHHHQLTMRFSIEREHERVLVFWEPYKVPEAIIGTDGRLLAGFDAARVLGQTPTSLRKAVSREYEMDSNPFCDDSGCGADGPRFPGGGRVRISYLRPRWTTRLMVTLSFEWKLLPRVRELVAASLGPGQQQGPDTSFVFVKDGVRYLWREDSEKRFVEIVIEKN